MRQDLKNKVVQTDRSVTDNLWCWSDRLALSLTDLSLNWLPIYEMSELQEEICSLTDSFCPLTDQCYWPEEICSLADSFCPVARQEGICSLTVFLSVNWLVSCRKKCLVWQSISVRLLTSYWPDRCEDSRRPVISVRLRLFYCVEVDRWNLSFTEFLFFLLAWQMKVPNGAGCLSVYWLFTKLLVKRASLTESVCPLTD